MCTITSLQQKRYRQYLEPGELYDVPESTLRYQREKQTFQSADSLLDGASRSAPTDSDIVAASEEGILQNAEEAAQHQGNRSDRYSEESGQSAASDIGEPEASEEFFDCQGETTGEFRSTRDFHPSDDGGGRDDDDVKTYINKWPSEKLPNLGVSKAQAVLLILTYVVHAGLTWSQIDGLLKLINTICGIDVVADNKYLFRKMWQCKMDTLNAQFFCKKCFKYLGSRNRKETSHTFTCSTCKVPRSVRSLLAQGSSSFLFSTSRSCLRPQFHLPPGHCIIN